MFSLVGNGNVVSGHVEEEGPDVTACMCVSTCVCVCTLWVHSRYEEDECDLVSRIKGLKWCG